MADKISTKIWGKTGLCTFKIPVQNFTCTLYNICTFELAMELLLAVEESLLTIKVYAPVFEEFYILRTMYGPSIE